MRIARESRGASASWTGHARAVATSAGTLFVRSYERGERVYLAMASRGYAGTMPVRTAPSTARAWVVCLLWPALAATVAVVAWSVQPVTPALALDVRGLGFRYPDGHRALDGVDLAVAAGERVADPRAQRRRQDDARARPERHQRGQPRGPSPSAGCPSSGPTWPRSAAGSGSCSRIPTTSCSCRRSREDVAFGPANLGLRGDELAARAVEALEAVGMAHCADRSPHHLSFGERRRVALATVLAMRPDVLVLDEPSSNLDPMARRELADIVARARRHDAPGHPRPAVRAAAVPPLGDPRRGPGRRRRADAGHPRRPLDDGRPPPGAAVRVRPPRRRLRPRRSVAGMTTTRRRWRTCASCSGTSSTSPRWPSCRGTSTPTRRRSAASSTRRAGSSPSSSPRSTGSATCSTAGATTTAPSPRPTASPRRTSATSRPAGRRCRSRPSTAGEGSRGSSAWPCRRS